MKMMKSLILICLISAAFIQGREGIILTLADSSQSSEAVDRLLSDFGLLPGWANPVHGVIPVVPTLDSDREALLEMLNRDVRIKYAEPDYLIRACGMPNDPYFKDQWALFNPDHARADIQAPEAWKITTGSRKIIVAIIDTGIDYVHPDLSANIWHNPGEIPNNGIDDDGNGYPDDVSGWSFAEDSPDPMDRYPHGTLISGIVGAVTNNHTGIAGLMHNVTLMAVKSLSDNGWGYSSDLIAGIYYAVDNGAQLINASWGGGRPQKAMTQAIAYAAVHNVIFVAAAGNYVRNNDKEPFYPSSYPNDNIVAVGASNQQDAVAPFSHIGLRSVDLFAPGVNVISTMPQADYGSASGTSLSAPYVTASLGLIMTAAPGAQYQDYISILLKGVTPLPGMVGKCVSGGRLNTAQALALRHEIFPDVKAGRTFRGVLSVLTQMTVNQNKGRTR